MTHRSGPVKRGHRGAESEGISGAAGAYEVVRAPMRTVVFVTALLLGLGLAAFVFIVMFDELPESKLLVLWPLPLLPFTFGLYGLLAGVGGGSSAPAASAPESRGQAVFGAVMAAVFRVIPPIISLGVALLLLLLGLPLMLIKSKNPFTVATVGTAMWVPLIAIFLVVFFPSL
jgi:hypothetical protein